MFTLHRSKAKALRNWFNSLLPAGARAKKTQRRAHLLTALFWAALVSFAVLFYFSLYQFAVLDSRFPPKPYAEWGTSTILLYSLLSAYLEVLGQVRHLPWLILTFALTLLCVQALAFAAIVRPRVWPKPKLLPRLLRFGLTQLLLLFPLLTLLLTPSLVLHRLLLVAESQVLAAQSALLSAKEPELDSQSAQVVTRLADPALTPRLLSGPYAPVTLYHYLLKGAKETNFLTSAVVPAVITNSPPFSLPYPVVLLPSAELALSPTLSPGEVGTILTSLAQHGLTKFLSPQALSLKRTPPVTLLPELAYNELAHKKITQKKQAFTTYLTQLKRDLEDNRTYLADTTLALTRLKQDRLDYHNRTAALLKDCRLSYPEAECQEAEQAVAKNLQDYDTEIKVVEGYLAQAESYVPAITQELRRTEEAYTRFLAYPIIPEVQVGIFEPPAAIYLKYSPADPANPAYSQYFFTLLHELLHYHSYRSGDNTPSFLEEGITDYLTEVIGALYTDLTSKQDGYVHEIEIIKTLVTKLGEDKLLKLYFGKSTAAWNTALTPVCGKTCFKQLTKIGDQLTYAKLDDTATRTELVKEAVALLNKSAE